MWPVVILNIVIFLFLAIGFLRPKRKYEWRSMSVFLGFLVVLFAEMYGFPRSIVLLVSLLGKNYPVLDPFSHPRGHLVLVFLGLAHMTLFFWDGRCIRPGFACSPDSHGLPGVFSGAD
jgi:methanethiol S-methyltransferase